MKVILIVLVSTFAIYNILVQYGVFEWYNRPSKVISELSEKKKINRKRKIENFKLSIYSSATDLFRGIFMSNTCYENHKYYIQRLDIRSTALDRLLTPEEVRGKYVIFVILGFLVGVLGIFYPLFFALPVIALVMLFTYQESYKAQIRDEDEIIDNYFIDLYLLLFSKLRQGSRARLQGSVENYIKATEDSRLTTESKVMLKLGKYFLNLLALYEDHVAVPKLVEVYHSATIINFCNVATQALNGIDNYDNLLTFKMQLTERKTNIMRERQRKILAAGERSIYAIWVILFIFIAVGWYSKIPTGGF